MKKAIILVVNPGSTSTKIALFEGVDIICEENLNCLPADISSSNRVIDQIAFRKEHVLNFLSSMSYKISDLDAIVARGGPLRPIPGGVYRINEEMLADAKSDHFVEHVSKIACVIASELVTKSDIPAFVVDPVSTDEFDALSRISGLKEVPRKSLTHALNMKAVARNYAKNVGKNYEELNLITAQLGGGCSVAVHERGCMIDAVDANGEGPFSPERSGGLRVDDLARFIFDSGKNFDEIRKILTRNGGLMSHLGSSDAIDIEKRMEGGDKNARLYYEAMAYSVSKNICALAAAVCGKLDALIVTGGLARSEILIDWIRERVEFLAPVHIMPGEMEMQALAEGGLRALSGEEKTRIYPQGSFYE